MHNTSWKRAWSRSLIGALVAPLLIIGCSSDTETKEVVKEVAPPRVVVTGEFLVLTNATTQLTATTADGTDAGYDWATSDASIATVSAQGVVKGVQPGKATITATGQTTQKAGTYNIVVSNDIPHLAEWQASGHGDVTAMAFNDWNDAGSVPTGCARCHSTPGFRDYLGDDGSAQWVVDAAAPIGTVVNCQACHNATASSLDQVTFPSGKTLTGLGPSARCMTCHQGREAGATVETHIATAKAAETDPASFTNDTVSAKLGFKNIHYMAAGATFEAGGVGAGAQYAGKSYDWRFRHVPGFDSCVECHDAHSLEIAPSKCASCHAGVVTAADFKKIRMQSSLAADYDGDGDRAEGIAGEVEGLKAALGTALQKYVVARGLSAICYDGHAYPYFFKDTNANGTCDATEAVSSNKYASWTARLERAAFNYQLSIKDAGAYAHNAKYVIELLFDSIEDLNAAIPVADRVNMTAMVREDPGHFAGSAEPARHWDADGAVGASCSKCHAGSEGLTFFLAYGVGSGTIQPGNGLECETCHTSFPATAAAPNLRTAPSVLFPSGKTVVADTADGANKLMARSFVCMTCHSGRESKASVDAAIAAGKPAFKNVHYMAAGATLLGAEAQVGYEYTGKTYAGRESHMFGIDCADCHSAEGTQHTFQVADSLDRCTGCHGAPTSVDDLRMSAVDYDYDGDTTEPLAAELEGLGAIMMGQMQATAALCYNGSAYPYFFKDTNADGTCDATESVSENKFAAWTAALSKAAFNYQFVHKDPGAWAHNMKYASQLLYDSYEDLGGDTTAMVRP